MSVKIPAALVVVAAAMGIAASSALAATPETKEATGVTAETATLQGVLNPGEAGEAGSYEFSYLPSSSLAPECYPGNFAPSSPVADAGAEGEAKSVTVTGLEPDREYAFCIVANSLTNEQNPGAAVPFTTLPRAPAVDSETATSVSSTTATLEAQINPENQETTYSFEYSTSSTLAGATVLAGAEPLAAEDGERTAGVPLLENLPPGTTYYYRVVAKNATDEETKGEIESFATVATPHTEAVTGVTATTATFHGKLTPLNSTVASEYSFDYNVGAECTGGSSTAPVSAGTGSGSKAVSTTVGELEPSASYSVCLVSSNAFGSEVDPTTPPVRFTTPAAPPTVGGETATVTSFEATLEAQVNPNNQETTYSFEYAEKETGGALDAPVTTLAGAAPLTGYGEQTASISTGRVLRPSSSYYFRVVAHNPTGTVTGAVEKLETTAAEAPVIEQESVFAVTAIDAQVAGVVDPNYQTTSYTVEYAREAALLGTPSATSVPGAAALPAVSGEHTISPVDLGSALAPNTTYFYRLIASNATGTTVGSSEEFKTLAAPSVTTGEAQNLTQNTAMVSGTVNPEGVEGTSYHVAYIDQAAYEAAIAQNGAGYRRIDPSVNPYAGGRTAGEQALSGAGTAAEAVNPVQLSELQPGTTYDYAIVATNTQGTTVIGPNQSFTTAPPTPPTAVTGIPVNISQISASITGGVNTQGLSTVSQFEFGPVPYAGTLTPASVVSSSGTTLGLASTFAGDLQPGTTYYYRVTASNQDGTAYGAEQSFTTASFPAAVLPSAAPALLPYTPISVLDAREAAEHKPTTTRTLTRAQKLSKALKACRKDQNKTKRATCKKQAHHRYPATKKKRTGKK